MTNALIFNIQRFNLYDGPGIRTLVFFKGCPLSCLWCSNPESQYAKPELMFHKRTCIACQTCVEVCPSGALTMTKNGISINRNLCDLCGICQDQCPTASLQLVGTSFSITEIMKVIHRDKEYFEMSGGGVTLSGGEPLLQADAAFLLLQECRKIGIHTAIETCGQVQREVLEKSTEFVDLYLYDIKTLITDDHIKGTGVRNELIINNLKFLIRSGVNLVLRFTLIPSFNMGEKNYQAMVSLIVEEGIKKVDLIPFHRLGQSKYDSLSRKYEFGRSTPLKKDKLLSFAQRLRQDTEAEVRIKH